jgi:hypothetical protein
VQICRNEIAVADLCQDPQQLAIVSQTRFHTREATAALLRMVKITSDPRIAAGLVDAAAGSVKPLDAVKKEYQHKGEDDGKGYHWIRSCIAKA